jgi:ATP adenylyltransferase/5',5'''-P-1,P-4-tetraphosphate phosphorylase II
MLKFITNLFTGKKEQAPVAPTPYKVEASKVVTVPKTAKKPTVKKATTAKTKKPKAPKV